MGGGKKEDDTHLSVTRGKLGSAKTLHAVKMMKNDSSSLKYYTNISAPFKNVVKISTKNIIHEQQVTEGKKTKTTFNLNWNYWRKQKKPLHIVWDEIHVTANSRSSMSKKNMIMVEFVAMARRITGMDEAGYGTLTFIAQTDFSIEKYIRHLSSEIVYHVMYWKQLCKSCGYKVQMTSESIPTRECTICRSPDTCKVDFFCICYHFDSFLNYEMWSQGYPGKLYSHRDVLTDIEDYFGDYDTLEEVTVYN